MNKKELYKEIAELHDVTQDEVEKEIRSAIRQAWTNPEKTVSQKYEQSKTRSQNKVPTPEDLIERIVRELREEKP